MLRLCPTVKRKTTFPVSVYRLCSNLTGAVSTLVQTCLCMGVRAVVTVARIASRTGPLVPRDNHSLAKGHWFFTDYCLLSTALTLSVPCRPMPMVSSVDQVAAYQVCSHPASVCLVDHVLHGDCPDVMTLGSQ